ncbi:MAG: hypothetical protein O3A68_06410 [Proteobacteria bacterium]|nr:hypothetical protein [Pseudomonadota bacterium]
MSQSIEVQVVEGILCADFNEGRLIIDTGSPVSLGPDTTIQLLGCAVQLNSTIGNYAWAQIQESLPFDAVGLIGVDAFSESSLGFDLTNDTLALLEMPVEGNHEPFVMGSPVIRCQIAEENLLAVLDTGAGLSYLRDVRLATFGKSLGRTRDFHPMLGEFEVETVECSVMVGDQSMTEVFGLATKDLQRLMQMAKIDAILGTSWFSKCVIEIDFKNELVGLTND